MPFPGDLSSLYTRNRFMGEVEQPTQAGGMQSPQFGGSPEQLMQILQHPQVQAGLQQFLGQGYHFDPSAMRQSPFLPNQFMQHHPMMGGALNNAMANVAATPEAPMVSGAGSGMSRAMQGMMGGPEMLRQYQIRQMLAPMQAAGMQMPMQEFQRKQQLLELLKRGEQHGEQMAESEEARRQQADSDKAKLGQDKLEMSHDYFPPGVPGVYQPFISGKPEMNMLTGIGGQGGGAGMIAPGSSPHYGPPQAISQGQIGNANSGVAGVAGAKETNATKNQKNSTAQDKRASARLKDRTDPNLRSGSRERYAGTGGVNPTQISGQYNKAEKDYRDAMAGYDAAKQAGKLDQKSYDAARTQALAALEQSKENTDQAQGNPGASARGQLQKRSSMLAPDAVQQNLGGQQSGGKGQKPQLHSDEAGNLWDMSSGQPVYAGKAKQ